MHPYNTLKKLLEPVFAKSGHRQVSEEYRPDAFGSAYSVFDNNKSKLMLVWDGKDGWGFVQLSAPNDEAEWKDIPCYLTEGDIETVPANQKKIDEFISAVERATR